MVHSLMQSAAATIASRFTGEHTRARTLQSFDENEMKILLLENINEAAVTMLREQGYEVGY